MAYTCFVTLAIAMIFLPTIAMATEYTVGDDKGWTNIDVNYTDWAKDKVFRVGDTLVFNYVPPHHNVFKVNGTEFKNCTIPPNGGLTSGHDIITLAIPGTKWYICGVNTHCADHGQKLAINVLADGPTPAPPAAAPAPSAAHHRIVFSRFRAFVAAVVAVVAIVV